VARKTRPRRKKGKASERTSGKRPPARKSGRSKRAQRAAPAAPRIAGRAASAAALQAGGAPSAGTAAPGGPARVRLASVAAPGARPGEPLAGVRGKYVYCIIRSTASLKFGPIGIGADPSDVHTVNYRDLAAVVSDTPMGVQDPTRENVLSHQRVNETVMRDHTVIPMSFGTVFKTREDILELLRSAYGAFVDVLTKMQDKFEFGLKVLWDRDLIVRQIEDEDEDIRRLKGEISSQKGSTYFARMQYGRMIDAALQAHSERYVAEIFVSLRGVSVASRANRPIGDKMILNAAFLVSRQKESEFDARVKEIGQRYDKLNFKYTGPWPPYNFVNIRLKLERAK
jgi:hypothetical protein